jgi:VIT1/CCC1 family predicted Fe2+/Mn2+ transporter
LTAVVATRGPRFALQAAMSQQLTAIDHRKAEAEARRAREELEQIKAHHGTNGRSGALRAAVFGVNDGLVSNFSLVLGVAAANPGNHFVLLAGVAGLVAGAFSMAAGEYISMRVQRELFEAAIARERAEIETAPEVERREVEVIFRSLGAPLEDARRLSNRVMADPEIALDVMARQELGLDPDQLGSPGGAAISSFGSFAIGALLPILPFMLLSGLTAVQVAVVLSCFALFAVGAATSRLSGRPMLPGGVRMLLIGAAAAAVTYVVGHILGVSIAG